MTDAAKTEKQPITVDGSWYEKYGDLGDLECEVSLFYGKGLYRLVACPIVERHQHSVVTSPLDAERSELLRVTRRSKSKDAEAIALAEVALPELLQKIAVKGVAQKMKRLKGE